MFNSSSSVLESGRRARSKSASVEARRAPNPELTTVPVSSESESKRRRGLRDLARGVSWPPRSSRDFVPRKSPFQCTSAHTVRTVSSGGPTDVDRGASAKIERHPSRRVGNPKAACMR